MVAGRWGPAPPMLAGSVGGRPHLALDRTGSSTVTMWPVPCSNATVREALGCRAGSKDPQMDERMEMMLRTTRLTGPRDPRRSTLALLGLCGAMGAVLVGCTDSGTGPQGPGPSTG